MSEPELDTLLRERTRADLRPHLARGQAADRRRPPSRGQCRRDDRRRGQRRARAAPRRHRRRHGPIGHRRRPRGFDDGVDGRQLRHHRRRRASGPSRLRQHPQVHPLHLRPHHARGDAVPRLRARGRSHPAPAHRAAAPRVRRRHGDASRPGPGARAGRARAHAAPAAVSVGGRDPAADAAAGLALPRGDLRRARDGRLLLRPAPGGVASGRPDRRGPSPSPRVSSRRPR